MRQPNFIIDLESFELVRDEVGVGRIKELPTEDASLLAKHIDGHPETLYVAGSGVNLSDQYGVFNRGQNQVAIEWVRHEPNPQTTEPECNSYRYLFGVKSDGTCIGIDVTKRPETGQVAQHWTTFDEAVNRHFPNSGTP